LGWLKDLMRSAQPPIAGYGELARRTLEHPEWPADSRPQARSLAALYSKLDRHIELDWLAEREAVQRTLALTLGCPLETVRRPLDALREAPSTRRVRLEDLPFAKPFDLLEEELPPGIPLRVLHPAVWRHLWWQAPSGSGRSLAGMWLSARGLATFLSARTWTEVAPRLPAIGPVFVELERAEDAPPLRERRGHPVDICIAAPYPPPLPGSELDTPWDVVSSPAPADFVGPLLAWIEARLPEDGAFEATAAEAWLAQPVADGALPTLGALLGAAGLLDAQGIARCKDNTLLEVAARFVSERLADASGKGSAEAQWLKRYGFDVLVKLAEEVLTSSDQPWEVARSEDEWIALIPAEFRQSVDSEWIQWSLSRAGGQTTARDLERALREVPPGAYRLLRALVDARLLRERGTSGRLVIAPELLKHAAARRACERLVHDSSAFHWGEALLRPHAAPSVLDALYERLPENDFGLVDALLELDLASQPALTAAAEAAFIGLGLHALCGAELSPEHVTGLWNEQLRWVVALPGALPAPRLLSFRGSAELSPLADPAVWGLAALALSELLPANAGIPHPLLRPSRTTPPTLELLQLLDAIHAVVSRPESEGRAWALGAFALIGRWSNTESAFATAIAAHPLARPALLVRTFAAGNPEGLPFDGFGAHAIEMRALGAECERQRIAWPRMAQALWRSWRARGRPETGAVFLGPEGPCCELFWPHLPAEVLDAAFSRWADEAAPWPLEHFGPNQWATFLARWGRHFERHTASRLWSAAFERMELSWLEQALGEGALWSAHPEHVRSLFAICWRRLPGRLLALVVERVNSSDADGLSRLLDSAPSSGDAALYRALAEALAPRTVQHTVLEVARAWLAARVHARSNEWRSAYALFDEIEARVARAARARGV
jgi:hypothetical protein